MAPLRTRLGVTSTDDGDRGAAIALQGFEPDDGAEAVGFASQTPTDLGVMTSTSSHHT